MRVAIVNDLRLACEALRRVVQSAPDLEVAWTASDGAEAVEKASNDRPDLLLMDLIMPRMDGAEATRRIMARSPCPILVVTSSVTGNIGKVYEAMGFGAVDAVDTPALGAGGKVEGGAALLDKIALVRRLTGPARGGDDTAPVPPRRAADDSSLRLPAWPGHAARPAPADGSSLRLPPRPATATVPSGRPRLVLIGASTGGPTALARILSALPAGLPASVVVAQHVDPAFAGGLVRWLGSQTPLPVEVAVAGRAPEPGRVAVASTGDHLVLTPDGRFRYTPEPHDQCYRPSVDVLLESARRSTREPGVAVLLTGMGRDGARGLASLRNDGWHTIAQDRDSSVIWGMPKAAVELGAATEILPLDRIAGAINAALGNTRPLR